MRYKNWPLNQTYQKPASILLFMLLFSGIIALSSCNKQYLRGHFTVEQFLDSAEWKTKIDEKYTPKAHWMDSIAQVKGSYDLRIYAGTYCPDSKKWIPRLLQLRPSLPLEEISVIAVDTTKKDKEGFAETEQIEKIPTFIFYKSGKEVGRIIEKPKGRLEKELYYTLKNK